jgi:hypothetical protein
LRGLLGLAADAPNRTLRFAPQLPAAWDSIKARNYAVGASRVSIALQRASASLLKLAFSKNDDEPLKLMLAPAMPALAKVRRVTVNGQPQAFTTDTLESSVVCRFEASLQRATNVEIEFDGGIEWDFPFIAPQIGDRTQNVKVLGTRVIDARTLAVTVEGLPQRRYVARLRVAAAIDALTGGTVVKEEAGWKSVEFTVSGNGTSYQRHELVVKLK